MAWAGTPVHPEVVGSGGQPRDAPLALRDCQSTVVALNFSVMIRSAFLVVIGSVMAFSWGQAPDNLVTENIPPIPPILRTNAARYLEFRSAQFQSWHPARREMLIATRFAEVPQLHYVRMPGGARRQLTFSAEPIAGGSINPKTGEYLLYGQDSGGGEFYQLYRFDLKEGKPALVTDGHSRNTGARWSNNGDEIVYTSTRRNGRDTDIYRMDPSKPESNWLLMQAPSSGWQVQDWSPDDSKLIVLEYVSINESYLHLVDSKSGARELLTPKENDNVAYSAARFARDGRAVFVTTDWQSEFQRLVKIDLSTKTRTALTERIPWDVSDFDLSQDGRRIAFVTNEDGISRLRILSAQDGKETAAPQLPSGVISNLEWHDNSRDLAFNLSSARSPSDVFSFNVETGQVERWTESEMGGLNPNQFVEPELVRMKSFDGLPISAFVYRPDPIKFPGKRPALILIHGGPESQSRPVFLARNNFYLNELGIALIVPNVRGSAGYGKTFLTLDNGFKREDSVRDIGLVIQWAKNDAKLDGDRLAVMGGSYGGYMVLASMVHFNDQLRAGIDVVGISNFLSFLRNTQDYRRDLRRAEYGDERDPAMRDFLQRISPLTSVRKIQKPLLVVQGKNDPRVPVTESEQMTQAIRTNGGEVWYLMAKDEGHGFAKKSNADYQFYVTILFLQKHLLPNSAPTR